MKGIGIVTESHASYADGQARGPTSLAQDVGEADLECRPLGPTSHILPNGKPSCIMSWGADCKGGRISGISEKREIDHVGIARGAPESGRRRRAEG